MLSAFSVEHCPPSRWNTVRHQHGIVSAIAWNTQLGELVALSAQGAVPDAELRARLEALITETQKRKPPSRASLVREGLIDGIRPVRSLLVAIAKLPWQATGEHPAIEYLSLIHI